jgi:hypothetical protein
MNLDNILKKKTNKFLKKKILYNYPAIFQKFGGDDSYCLLFFKGMIEVL